MENSYPDDRQYFINVFRRTNRFLVVCEYDNKFTSFLIYLTKNSQILPLNSPAFKINIRNESQGNSKSNWKFSTSLSWKGRNENVNPKETSFVGLVL